MLRQIFKQVDLLTSESKTVSTKTFKTLIDFLLEVYPN